MHSPFVLPELRQKLQSLARSLCPSQTLNLNPMRLTVKGKPAGMFHALDGQP